MDVFFVHRFRVNRGGKSRIAEAATEHGKLLVLALPAGERGRLRSVGQG